MLCLVVVLIDAGGAEVLIASVLLDRRLSPSAEGSEVGEGRVVIVVSVPQWIGGELSRSAHDRVPLARTAVDTYGKFVSIMFEE